MQACAPTGQGEVHRVLVSQGAEATVMEATFKDPLKKAFAHYVILAGKLAERSGLQQLVRSNKACGARALFVWCVNNAIMEHPFEAEESQKEQRRLRQLRR